MLFSLLYTFLRVAFGSLILIRDRAGQTELENAVLRHQLKVLSRTQPVGVRNSCLLCEPGFSCSVPAIQTPLREELRCCFRSSTRFCA